MDSSDGNSQPRLNPYASPKSSVEAIQIDELALASLWRRLFARLIDFSILFVISIHVTDWLLKNWPVQVTNNHYIDGFFWSSNTSYIFLDLFVGIGVFAILNTYLLATRGQTIGKYLLKIRIVDHRSDEVSKLRFSLLLREGITMQLSLFGTMGMIIALIDVLFIFFPNRRCLHDYWSFTKVVSASKDPHRGDNEH